jgi:hypothetical protein
MLRVMHCIIYVDFNSNDVIHQIKLQKKTGKINNGSE